MDTDRSETHSANSETWSSEVEDETNLKFSCLEVVQQLRLVGRVDSLGGLKFHQHLPLEDEIGDILTNIDFVVVNGNSDLPIHKKATLQAFVNQRVLVDSL